MFKAKSKLIYVMMVAVLALILGACSGGDGNDTDDSDAKSDATSESKGSADVQSISFVTGGPGGTFYPLGVGMADVINDAGIANVTVETSDASIENTRLLGAEEAEIGLLETGIAYFASEGIEMFDEDQITNVRGVMTLYPNLIQMVVMADSGIETYADLKGKKVVVGQPGSSSMLNLDLVLEQYGLEFDDITPQYSDFSQGIDMLKDGQVDATLVDIGIPAPAIIDISSQHDIHILSIDEDKIDNIATNYPYFTNKIVIPAGTYNNVDEDVITAGVPVMLGTHEDVSEDLVYEMTKILFEKKEDVVKVHPAGESIDPDSATEGLPIPLHPGAEKYLKEIGKLD